jgi:chemotaxis signal transduction protein
MENFEDTMPIAAQKRITSLNLVQSFDRADEATTELEDQADTRHVFKIGSLGFLVPDGITAEIVVDVKISSLPNSPEHLVGIGSARAVVFPVFDLHRQFNAEPTANRYLLLIDFGGDRVALYIDSTPLLIAIKNDDEELIGTDQIIDSNMLPFVKKVYRKDFICLDFDFYEFFQAIAHD